MNRPYSEATVELVAAATEQHHIVDGTDAMGNNPCVCGQWWDAAGDNPGWDQHMAEVALDALAAAGLLLPEGVETRTEWGVRLVWDDGRPDDIFPAADHADAVGRFRIHRRMRAQGGWLVTPHIVRREALSYAGPWTASDAVRLAVGDSKPFQDPSVSVEEAPQ